jgi:hypothetical protein
MPRNPGNSTSVSRRHFLAVAGSVAATCSLSAGNGSNLSNAAAASINYPVTIDARTTPFTYTTSVPMAATPAYHLHVASANSTVSFTVITSGANQHSAAIFFPNDTPLVDKNGRPMQAFVWSQTEESAPAMLPMDPDASGQYEYRIVVFDKVAGTTTSEDPKFIVGGGGIELTEIIEKLNEIKKEHPGEDKTIESIKTELQQLFIELK